MCLIGNSHPAMLEVWGWQVADKLFRSTAGAAAALPPIPSSPRRTINGTTIKLKDDWWVWHSMLWFVRDPCRYGEYTLILEISTRRCLAAVGRPRFDGEGVSSSKVTPHLRVAQCVSKGRQTGTAYRHA